MFKTERFKDEEEFQDYKDAEAADPAVIRAYLDYSGATYKRRNELAIVVDRVRYKFFRRWREERESIK